MSKEPVKDAESASRSMSADIGHSLQVALTIGDTTWRMFVPLVLTLLLGQFADDTWRTKPWGLTFGIICGVALSAYLVVKQLKQVEKE